MDDQGEQPPASGEDAGGRPPKQVQKAEPAPLAEVSKMVYRMIQSSPPGQLGDVLAACQQLTLNKIPQDVAARSCADYNEKNLLAVSFDTEGAKELSAANLRGIVSECNRKGGRTNKVTPYLDPRSHLLFHVDQETMECVKVTVKKEEHNIAADFAQVDEDEGEPYRLAMQRELDKYVAQKYPAVAMGAEGGAVTSSGRRSDLGQKGQVASAVHTFAGKDVGGDLELRMMISARRVRPRGHWAGTWTSQWRILWVPGQEEPASLGGVIDFASHYSEDGNAHFKRHQIKKEKVSPEVSEDPDRLAKEVVRHIRRLEDEFHEDIEDMCETFGSTALKAMRRVLPMSKERFSWQPLRHAIVRDIKEAGQQLEREHDEDASLQIKSVAKANDPQAT